MNPALVAIAAITIAGAVLAVSARDVRAALLGLLVVLLAAPLIADPWPDPLAILARITATLLAVRLVGIGLRGDVATGGTRIGWPAEALLAIAGAVIGFGSHGLGAAGLGPAEAQAAGLALIVVAAAPLFTGRDVLRLAVGAVLLLVGAMAIRNGLDPSPSQGEELVGAILTIAIGGAIAVIATAAQAAGGLDAVDAGRPGMAPRRLPDAHRLPDRPVRAGSSDRGPVTSALGRRRPGPPDGPDTGAATEPTTGASPAKPRAERPAPRQIPRPAPRPSPGSTRRPRPSRPPEDAS